jgi:hypothetical protein
MALAVAQLLLLGGCATRLSALAGWRALQAGINIRLDDGLAANRDSVLSVTYTIVPGRSYGIERPMQMAMGHGRPEVHLQLKATRVLHLALVLIDETGMEHEAARTLTPGGWRSLHFDDFCPPLEDGTGVRAMRIVDRTGALGGQGPVSLKLVGLPLDR